MQVVHRPRLPCLLNWRADVATFDCIEHHHANAFIILNSSLITSAVTTFITSSTLPLISHISFYRACWQMKRVTLVTWACTLLTKGWIVVSFAFDDVGGRRNFVEKNVELLVASTGILTSTIALSPKVANANGNNAATKLDPYGLISSLLEENNVSWLDSGPAWKENRYRTTTLSASNNAAPPSGKPTYYPEWMEGYWSATYKFKGASFPQGRSIISLRIPGAGLGTCLELPNVGYNPSTFPSHFMKKQDLVYEDLAYNVPRRFEAFWPDSKVLSVNVGQSDHSSTLTPKCFLTGDGCAQEENPLLHSPSSRYAINFDGPTRRGGRLTQASDVTILDSIIGGSASGAFAVSKNISQYNVNQELQTFYKVITSFERVKNSRDLVLGRVRVAAFLPLYIKEMDSGSFSSYDENAAVALYDYKIVLKKIDENEAATL
jgi:hypothetical protein